MFKTALFALFALAVAALGPAAAQSKKGEHGGMVVASQGHPIEFVLKGEQLAFYLNDDDGSPLATKDMQARATVQDGGKTSTVTLQPAPPNMMVGKLSAPLGSKARVVFSANVRLGSHSHTLTARYVTE